MGFEKDLIKKIKKEREERAQKMSAMKLSMNDPATSMPKAGQMGFTDDLLKKIVRKATEDSARKTSAMKLSMNIKDHPSESIPKAGQCFEDVVRANFASGLNKGESVRKAVADCPALHEEWLARLRTGKNGALKKLLPESIPKAGQCFEDVVRANFASGSTKAASIRKAVADCPALHEEWLARLSTGKNNALKDLFPKE
jgi:hypothetical protein